GGRGRPTPRQAPGVPAVRPQTFGDGTARQPGKLAEPSNSQLAQLPRAPALEREQLERKRPEELAPALVRDDERLTRPRDARGGERSEPALRRPDPRLPARPDRGERPLERLLEPSVAALAPPRLDVDAPGPGRLHGDTRLLPPA